MREDWFWAGLVVVGLLVGFAVVGATPLGDSFLGRVFGVTAILFSFVFVTVFSTRLVLSWRRKSRHSK